MPIFFNELTKEFHLQTSESSYIFCVLENGHLGHLYYGSKLNHQASFQKMIHFVERPNTNYEWDNQHTFSLSTIKQEYPTFGTTDYRDPACQFNYIDGSSLSNFQFDSFKIYQGKRKLEGLPSTYVEDKSEATTLDILLHDKLTNMSLTLKYTVFEHHAVITRSVIAKNNGTEDVSVERLMSGCIDFDDSNFEMLQLSGAWIRERHLHKRQIVPGIQSISSNKGASSAHQNPFLAIKRPDTTEEFGEVYGFSLVYSGNFLAQVEVDHYDVTRVLMGINPFQFNFVLEPENIFVSPELVMVYSNKGITGMSQTFHRLFQKRLMRGEWRDKPRPILVNSWEGTYFDFNEEKILEMAKASKRLGAELFVLDDGWFGQRNSDTSSLGDWFANKEKLPEGIKGVASKIKELDLDFGLWFEPEMISKKSKLYQKYPQWALQVKNRKLSQGRNQYVLDFSNSDVVNYIYKMMIDILDNAPVSYIKWDMNRYMSEVGSLAMPANQQRSVAHRYILGVYQLYERLIKRYPHILFESCAGGGGRFDPGMLYYAPQAWTSDNTDAVERLKIQYGTSLLYPINSIGAHVSASPNHQIGRQTSLESRYNTAIFGLLGYELDVTKLTQNEEEKVKSQIEFYKQYRDLIISGNFYRIKSPFEKDGNCVSWNVVSKNKDAAIFGYYQVLSKPNAGYTYMRMRGLNPQVKYYIPEIKETYSGDELMQQGVLYERYFSPMRDFSSIILTLEMVRSLKEDV